MTDPNGVPDWRTTLISNELADEVLAEQEAAAVEIAYERPKNGIFFRCHPTIHRPVFFIDRAIGGNVEHCLVMSEDVIRAHKTRCKLRHCYLYAREDGGLGVWAVSLHPTPWSKTALAAATASLDGWISVHSDMAAGKYRIHRPTDAKLDELNDPKWPTQLEDVAQAIMRAWDDPERYVTSLEHPAVAGFGQEIRVELEG
jgi:hypothetical protein